MLRFQFRLQFVLRSYAYFRRTRRHGQLSLNGRTFILESTTFRGNAHAPIRVESSTLRLAGNRRTPKQFVHVPHENSGAEAKK